MKLMTALSICLTTILAVLNAVAPAAAGTAGASVVFQFAVPVEREEKSDATAFCWIPPEAQAVRGIVISGKTLMEAAMSKDPLIRAACADQQLAIIYMNTGLGSADIQQVLDDLAGESGYQELSVAPLLFVGHSAGGPQAQRLAVKMADRCFGLVQFRGGGPWNGEPVPAGIPTLMMVGQFDEFGGTMRTEDGRENWHGSRDALAKFRSENPDRLASIFIEPGAGHFAWSDNNAEYLAKFIAKAAATQIPESWPTDAKQVELNRPSAEDGWLTDLAIEKPDHRQPAAWSDYAGDKTAASWHFDRELARTSEKLHEGINRKDQFIKWNDRYWVDAGTRFFFLNPKWVGPQTIEVHPQYAEVYPGQHNGRGPKWLKAGEPVGHADAPIKLDIVGGPMVPVGDNKLRIRFDALSPAGGRTRITFMAYSEGDDEYRLVQQVGMMPRGFKGLNKGAAQTISFPELPDVPADHGPIDLEASSDAGLPVEYYIAHGPARIDDGKLVLTQIPPRAKFPIEVKVVAYQFGSAIDPRVKTADPVERTFQITEP